MSATEPAGSTPPPDRPSVGPPVDPGAGDGSAPSERRSDAPPDPPAAPPDAPPDAPFGGEQMLPPPARWLFHVRYLMSLVLVLVPGTLMLGFAATFVTGLVGAGVLVAVLLLLELLYTIWWPSLSYERFTWQLRDDALIVSQGVVFRDRTAIPLGRVQHVDVRQGPLEQWLSLARVHVHTASGVGADGAIPGLRIADAERLRDELVARVGLADDGV